MTTEEDTSYTKLSTEQKCVDKSWKVRKNGYEEAIILFEQLDEKAPEWNKFTEVVNKFVIDSNVAAQEKGLEATLAFIENFASAGRVAEDVMTGLITKCYGSSKAKIKDIAVQITLVFIEIEMQNVVIEALVKGMDHKFPKIASTCIRVATQGINEFGSKVLNTKLLLKKLQSILEDKDKSVRDEAKLLAIEICSWIGLVPIKANLANLKPVQIQELEAEFVKVSGNKPQPTRFLRSEKNHATISDEAMTNNGDVVLEDDIYETDDPVKHIDPVNILSQLSKDFYEKLEAKKWQERKENIEMLEGILIKAPKLEMGDYGELVRALRKIITKDSNVVIVGVSVKCMTMLAKGLKKQFETYATDCLPELLEKFKEKKLSVVLPLRDAIDAIYLNMTLESIHEDILISLNSKNPSVKAESVAFLARCFTKCTPTILNKKLLKIFTTVLIKTLNESDKTVRDNSAEALGTAWKVVSEKNIIPYLTNVDAIKLAKIKEAAEKAIITAKPTSVVVSKPVSKSSSNTVLKKTTALKNSKNSTDVKKHLVHNNKIKKLPSAGSHKVLPSKASPSIETEIEICDDELEELALTFCSSDILNGMIDTNWKTRLFYVQNFYQLIDELESQTVSSQVLIKLLNKKPGIKDNNVQTQKLKLECLKNIIEKFPITNIAIECCLKDVSSLLGDNKNGNLADQILTTLAESTRLDLVSNAVLDYAFTVQKNPKVQIGALNWLSCAILEFGFIIEPQSIFKNVKKAVNSSNPQVRMAVISFLGVLYLYMGPQLNLFFENENANLVQQINAEFKKHQGEAPPKPTRREKRRISTKDSEITSDDGIADYKVNIRDIVPRVDITSQITNELINAFSDRDWKVRSDALTKLHKIVTEAKFITSELGEIREVLKERINDSNARICSNTMNLVALISVAMGSSFKSYIKCYLPCVLSALGDLKPFKSQSARYCMDTWADICGYREFFGGDILVNALKKESVTQRSEIMNWLAEKLPIIPTKTIPAEELKCLLSDLYISLEFKNASVRKASEKAVLGFMMHLGYATMYGACEKLKLKPMSVTFCRARLDEERQNLPIVNTESPKIVKPDMISSLVTSKGSKILPSKNTINKEKNPITSVAIKKTKETVNGPLFQQNNLKHQRDIDENKIKALKWNFITPREEFVNQLREQMCTAGINKELISEMFHTDFSHHIKAISILSKDLMISDDNNLALINNLDLILKWVSLRFFDTNPSVLIKGLDYLQHIFDILIAQKYTLHDTEASSFVPYLVTKLGDPKDMVRNYVRAILIQIAFIFPRTKLFQYIMDGVKSKNARQRSECLEHLATMIEVYGSSVCQPSVASAFKEIVKSIGDRDKSVRTAALNCCVTAYFIHGDAFFKFIGRIPEKDMGLLRERLKRASKNRAVPDTTIQPTTTIIIPPAHQVLKTEELVHDEYCSDYDDNNLLNVIQESDYVQSSHNCSTESLSEHENNTSCKTEDVLLKHSSLLDAGFSEAHEQTKPQMKRFSLDENFMKELDAEVITTPKLILKPYTWTADDENISFGNIQQQSPSMFHQMPLSQSYFNISPYSHAAFTHSLENIKITNERIQQLISQISSNNIVTAKTAVEELNKILLSSLARSELVKCDKVLILFYAINIQLEILSELKYENVFRFYDAIIYFCLNLCKCQGIISKLNEEVLRDLLFRLINHLSLVKSVKNSDTNYLNRVNHLVVIILMRSNHTLLTCSLLAMLYDTVEHPQDFTTEYKELLTKCIWKNVKDLPKWADDICYDAVLAQLHRFFEKFKVFKGQPTNIPWKTCKTVLYIIVKLRSDKVLKSLDHSKFPKDSTMAMYVCNLIKYFNRDPVSKNI